MNFFNMNKINSDVYNKRINYKSMSKWQIQARLIYSIIVAGKTSKFAHSIINKLFTKRELPFNTINKLIKNNLLEQKLREVKTGNYKKMLACFPEIIKLNPYSCSLEELEQIPGIGRKTSRFYFLWIGKEIKCAALDVHILHFLRDLGYDAPKNTPSSKKKYKELEDIFLEECKKRNKTPNQLDGIVWYAYAHKNKDFIDELLNYKKEEYYNIPKGTSIAQLFNIPSALTT